MTVFLIQVRGTAIENRFLHHEAEGASEASSTRPEVYSSRSEHLPEAPKCIHPGMYDCLKYNGTYRRTKRVDNGVLDTLKRHLWTNRLEG